MLQTQTHTTNEKESTWGLFLIFLRLGLTSFGGPIAHLGYFRDEFVARRHWLSEQGYADLVALCQFLPGPASSQVGMAVGILRHGYPGAFVAWAGFTLPSAVALILFALGISHGSHLPPDMLHGLKLAAVAVVAQAVLGMARKLCTDAPRIAIAALAAGATLLLPGAAGQLAIIVVAGVGGVLILQAPHETGNEPMPVTIAKRAGIAWLALFCALLALLPLLASTLPWQALADVSAFFRTGALVFGGGHVVLPLLQAEVVPGGLVSNDVFLAGYGAAQAVPGPLFTFAAFLGASMQVAPSGWSGGMICLLAIFAPSFLLVAGTMPFWADLRRSSRMRSALGGVNAAVVGLLAAALYYPVGTSALFAPKDFIIALAALAALQSGRCPPWLAVLCCAAAGALLG
ncbi:chromate efflux transporter [Herbaspirillum robiniae]|uniref:Chromate transporter n=1 Tax=Herbaspirillum robiniae TaxID=2014887 RepID=A0A246WN04_9BURK|nr:chromate efflux transporter [Herbaspirillum robiniae]OWY27638.1 chromate transporter [Herbaspirillum robiniae]